MKDAGTSQLTGVNARAFEITRDKGKLSGRIVGIEGSVRPIKIIHFQEPEFTFQLPPQNERHKGTLFLKESYSGTQL